MRHMYSKTLAGHRAKIDIRNHKSRDISFS